MAVLYAHIQRERERKKNCIHIYIYIYLGTMIFAIMEAPTARLMQMGSCVQRFHLPRLDTRQTQTTCSEAAREVPESC